MFSTQDDKKRNSDANKQSLSLTSTDSFGSINDFYSSYGEDEGTLMQVFVSELGSSNLNPISKAALEGVLSEYEFSQLIEANLDLINDYEEVYLFTALHVAVIKRRVDYVEALMAFQDLDVNQTASGNTSALIFAADFGYEDIVLSLMQHEDIDINIIDAEGNTALSFALDKWREDIIDLILTRGQDNENLFLTIEESPTKMNLFYKLNYHPNFKVSGEDAVELATKLRDHGANFNKVFNDLKYINMNSLFNGGTLEQSISRGNAELLEFFLDEFKSRFRPKMVEALWKLHMKVLYSKLNIIPAEIFDHGEDEFEKANKVSRIMRKFVKDYEKQKGVKISKLSTLVGGRNK